jgi:hypothetical protein
MIKEIGNAPRIFMYYEIIIEGKIESSWSDWLNGFQLTSRKESDGMQVTTLRGVRVDQAGLRGLLNRIWDLNLVLRSIQPVDPTTNNTD